MHPYEEVIGNIMDTHVIKAVTTDDQEEVAESFRKYDLLSLPVVDHENRLVGIVTVDDVVDVMEQEAAEDFEKMAAIFLKYWDKYLIDGVSYTLLLSAITVLGGVVFASLLALMKMSKVAPLRWLSTIYIEVIRGTPMLLQLYFFYFGLPMLIPTLNKQKFLCIAIALICNSAAYVSEVIRSGIQAVDPGQREAALSLGFGERGAMWFVIMPQAVKNILPALGNEFIMIIKDTSLASTFFIGDLMTQYLQIRGATYLPIEPLVITGIIYFIMTFALSKLFGHFEHKMQRSDRQSGTARQRKSKREGAVA